MQGFISGPSILFHWSLCLFSCQDHTDYCGFVISIEIRKCKTFLLVVQYYFGYVGSPIQFNMHSLLQPYAVMWAYYSQRTMDLGLKRVGKGGPQANIWQEMSVHFPFKQTVKPFLLVGVGDGVKKVKQPFLPIRLCQSVVMVSLHSLDICFQVSLPQ